MAAATTPKLKLKRGTFITDGARLMEVLRVSVHGVQLEDAATGEVHLILKSELVSGGWRSVDAKPFDAEEWERAADERRAKDEARVMKRG